MNPRKRLRELIAATRYVIVPGAYDALNARLVQVAGFDAVYLTGGGYSRANGYPDIGLLTMSEVTQWISRTVDAVEIPVIADMDAGYGNAPLDQGTIRVDVKPRPKRVDEPIAMPDTLTLYGQAPGIVDVLANDLDPAGGLLTVQRATTQRTGAGRRIIS